MTNAFIELFVQSYYHMVGGVNNAMLLTFGLLFFNLLTYSWVGRFGNLIFTWLHAKQRKKCVVEVFTKIGWRQYVLADPSKPLLNTKEFGAFIKRPETVRLLPAGVPFYSVYEGSCLPISYEEIKQFNDRKELEDPEKLKEFLKKSLKIEADEELINAVINSGTINVNATFEYLKLAKDSRDINTQINGEVVIAKKKAYDPKLSPQFITAIGILLLLTFVGYNMYSSNQANNAKTVASTMGAEIGRSIAQNLNQAKTYGGGLIHNATVNNTIRMG